MRATILSFILLFSYFGTTPKGPASDHAEIRLWIKSLTQKQSSVTDSIINTFYEHRKYVPLWNSKMAGDLLTVLRDSKYEGLDPELYEVEKIEKWLLQSKNYQEMAALEVALTSSFLLYANHLLFGTANPQTIYPNWKITRNTLDAGQALKNLSLHPDIFKALRQIAPKGLYLELVSWSTKYHSIRSQGGWPVVAEGSHLQFGSIDPRIPQLRKRLWLTEDLTELDESNDAYDRQLEEAVKRFQHRMGLDENGVVDDSTIEELNHPVEERIATIFANLERLRWTDRSMPETYIFVNIPAFDMYLIKNDVAMLSMPVAVGKPDRETPVFNAQMNHLVVNPFWTVPPSILAYDILPAVQKNPEYLNKLNIRVVNHAGAPVNIGDIDWNTTSARSFPYMLRQDPGTNNALGKVKFMFPNPYNIYMHDTNHPEIFQGRDLAKSSGCIRLSDPIKLARYLVDEMEIEKIKGKNQVVMLKEHVPVFIEYKTAFVDQHGGLHFRKDIYNKDQVLIDFLASGQPDSEIVM